MLFKHLIWKVEKNIKWYITIKIVICIWGSAIIVTCTIHGRNIFENNFSTQTIKRQISWGDLWPKKHFEELQNPTLFKWTDHPITKGFHYPKLSTNTLVVLYSYICWMIHTFWWDVTFLTYLFTHATLVHHKYVKNQTELRYRLFVLSLHSFT